MRYSALPQLEANFLATGNNGEYELKKIAVPVPGENLTLNGMFCTPKSRSGYYHAVAHPKERILLHFTAGQIRSDMSALTRQDYHVSTPFVIGRNGTIYQLYSSKFWSGNIGKGRGNANNAEDKKTIGIEISNYGFVTEKDGNLETIYSRLKDSQGRTGPVDVYCSLTETAAYQKITTPFRGQSYYPTYTKEQYESLIILLRYLTATYNIPRQFLPENKRYIATDDVLSFKGIVSHVNYRDTGKWDIGPAFDWNTVIKGVQAASFQPTATRSASRKSGSKEKVITSEKQMEKLAPKAAKGAEPKHEELQDIDSTAVLEAKGAQKKLYALVVGINDYNEDILLEQGVIFPKLSGCVSDAEKVKAYLESQTQFDLQLKMLTDAEATKEGIVKGFQEHLSQAGKDDTVMFYYSGHGTQEFADEKVWTNESDGRHECLACYYDKKTKSSFLLADKELRYLINEVAAKGCHVLAMFDCCHSGGNTRNASFVAANFKKVVEKRIPFSFKQRAWTDFIFSKQISRQQVIDKGDEKAIPEGLHVQLAACEADESAVEVDGEGVFTKALLATLTEAKGDVTYHALRSRVRQYLRNVYEQKPRIYVVKGDEGLLYTNFLKQGSGGGNLSFGDVLYNEETGWQLSLGAIHGIGENTKTIRVLDAEKNNKEYEAVITKIKADTTLLRFAKTTKLNEKKVYKGYVENLLTTNIRVAVNNVDGTVETQKELMELLTTPANAFIQLTEKEAQYVVHNSNGQLFITQLNDDYRPLVKPAEASASGVNSIVAYLKQMAQWEHLKSLTNNGGDGNVTGKEIEVSIKAINNNGKKELPVKKGTAVVAYEQKSGKWKAALEIQLKNTTTTPLYCSVLYLTSNFGTVNNFLPALTEYIEPGKSVKLKYNGNDSLPFSLNAEVEWYNWKEQTEYLKVIVNTEEFDAASLSLAALPSPVIPVAGTKGLATASRGLDTEPDTEGLSGWGTQTITLQQPNPLHNNVDESKIQQMLEDAATANFALGLYFDVTVDANMQPVYTLKPSLKKNFKSKGFLGDKVIDVANWWSRRKRNNRYRDTVANYPERIRIVSEGDSWFQHPLVLDIIDHLSRTYAVYCVAAAGDTLRNYQSGKKTNGEYYLDALEKEKPAYFLISGGGNDILGSQFRSYLQDKFDTKIEEGKTPERFLRDSINKEMESLADIYRSVFQHLKKTYPNLKVIVHGYDYPIKLDDAKKGWLGRYMIEKGIKRPGDRKAIIAHIMDEFNRRLKEVSLEFSNVTYLDLRGIVRYNPADNIDQWYDEIHPNDEGFQQIAMKYMQAIDK